MNIDNNIKQALLSHAPLTAYVGTKIYFPFADSDTGYPYISFFEITSPESAMKNVNEDIYQFDIYVTRDKYTTSKKIKNIVKNFLHTAIISNVHLIYVGDSVSFQEDKNLYRRIMTYQVNNKS